MPSAFTSFNRYTIYCYSSSLNEVQYRITCYNDNDLVGKIYFYRDDISIPENDYNNNNIRINLSSSRFPQIVDILRNEEPLYLWLDLNNFTGLLYTNKEDVGEEEGI